MSDNFFFSATGLNCKIRVLDLIQSIVYKYLSQGGLCRVIVRGTIHIAPTPEQGWISTSTRYLQVTYITQVQSEFFDEEINNQRQQQQSEVATLSLQQELEQKSQTTTPSSSQQHRRSTSVPSNTTTRVWLSNHFNNISNKEKEKDYDDDSDLDYDSFDAEEEEQDHLNDTEFDDYNESMEEDISSEDIDRLNAEANMPLDMDYMKKRDAEDFLENENNKKRKHTSSSSACCCCPVVIDLE